MLNMVLVGVTLDLQVEVVSNPDILLAQRQPACTQVTLRCITSAFDLSDPKSDMRVQLGGTCYNLRDSQGVMNFRMMPSQLKIFFHSLANEQQDATLAASVIIMYGF